MDSKKNTAKNTLQSPRCSVWARLAFPPTAPQNAKRKTQNAKRLYRKNQLCQGVNLESNAFLKKIFLPKFALFLFLLRKGNISFAKNRKSPQRDIPVFIFFTDSCAGTSGFAGIRKEFPMTKKKHGLFFGFAALCLAAIFSLTFAACNNDSEENNSSSSGGNTPHSDWQGVYGVSGTVTVTANAIEATAQANILVGQPLVPVTISNVSIINGGIMTVPTGNTAIPPTSAFTWAYVYEGSEKIGLIYSNYNPSYSQNPSGAEVYGYTLILGQRLASIQGQIFATYGASLTLSDMSDTYSYNGNKQRYN
jgi:hypothetical protein